MYRLNKMVYRHLNKIYHILRQISTKILILYMEYIHLCLGEINRKIEKSSDSGNFIADFHCHPCYYIFMTKIIKIKGH